MSTGSSSAERLEELAAMDRSELARRWELVFDCDAPQRCRAPFLRLALGWHLQMAAHHAPRKLTPSQMLRQIKARPHTARALVPGTQLAREWQGRSYLVNVTAEGFECDGKAYRSLSAIARAITGTPWSGPLFFGLRT